MDKKSKRWLVIVNLMTISRIVGSIFLFPIFFHYGQKTVGIILSILFLTDWIDGFLARRHHVSTFFGSIMDGVCDKVVAIVSCIILCYINKFMIICIFLEILIFLVNTFVLTQNGNIKSSKIGKAKMWVISSSIVAGFLLSSPSKTVLNLIIAVPAIIAETITLIDYIRKIFGLKISLTAKKPHYKSGKDIKKMLFNPDFYDRYKDEEGLISHVYKNEK